MAASARKAVRRSEASAAARARLLADELDPLLLRPPRLAQVAGVHVEQPLLGVGGGRPGQPAIAAGLGGEAVLEVGDGFALGQLRELLFGLRAVVRVDELQERPRLQLVVAEAQGLAPAGVQLAQRARHVGDPEHVEGEGEEAVALGLRLQPVRGLRHLRRVLALLEQPHLLGLPLDLLRLLEQVDEHRDLGLQDLRDHRGLDEVDRAQGIAAEDLLLVQVHGGEEDDRRALRALAGADHLRGLEAVHPRHVDVEEDDREVLLQEGAQRLAAGVRADHVLAQLAEDRLQREQLVRAVVDEEDVDLLVVGAGGGVDRVRRHQTSLLDRGYITPPCGRCARPGLRSADWWAENWTVSFAPRARKPKRTRLW